MQFKINQDVFKLGILRTNWYKKFDSNKKHNAV
ncbi:Uncharacterised protein [Orientia tsutsugamushi]|nr:Uncharacterised protein [Orientia tsutsugamushi]